MLEELRIRTVAKVRIVGINSWRTQGSKSKTCLDIHLRWISEIVKKKTPSQLKMPYTFLIWEQFIKVWTRMLFTCQHDRIVVKKWLQEDFPAIKLWSKGKTQDLSTISQKGVVDLWSQDYTINSAGPKCELKTFLVAKIGIVQDGWTCIKRPFLQQMKWLTPLNGSWKRALFNLLTAYQSRADS